MQIILDNGTVLTPKHTLGEVVAMTVQTDVVGVVVSLTVMDGGSFVYDVSVAGNPITVFEPEIVETVVVEATEDE